MGKLKQLQQGDINIVQVSDIPTVGGHKWNPSKLAKHAGTIIREGETTGHAHRLTGKAGMDFQLYQLGTRLFARILSGNVRIIHEEHGMIELPVGEYEFTPVIEYDHFAEESRAVRD